MVLDERSELRSDISPRRLLRLAAAAQVSALPPHAASWIAIFDVGSRNSRARCPVIDAILIDGYIELGEERPGPNPLLITCSGIAQEEAERFVSSMSGEHRLPALLGCVDRASRGL